MARAGRQFLPLDCGYFDDHRVVELSDGAQLLDIRAMLLAKRLLTDGRLTRRQLERIAPSGGDIGAMIGELIATGLWVEQRDALARHGWATWNDAAADVETMSKGGIEGNHLRWHVKRNVLNPDCPLCASGDIGGESGGDVAPDRGANRREEERREDVEERSSGAVASVTRLPVVSEPTPKPAARRSRAPEHFEVTDALRAWAAQQPHLRTVDLDAETRRFVDHHRAKGSLFADWSAAWRTWMGRVGQYDGRTNGRARSRNLEVIDVVTGGH